MDVPNKNHFSGLQLFIHRNNLKTLPIQVHLAHGCTRAVVKQADPVLLDSPFPVFFP